MIKVNIEELLKKNGKTKYWLCNKMGTNYHNLNKIIYGATKSISFKNIEKLCKYLNCTPSELLIIKNKK